MASVYLEGGSSSNVLGLFLNDSLSSLVSLNDEGAGKINLYEPGTYEVCEIGREMTTCSLPVSVSWEAAFKNLEQLISSIFKIY